MPNDKDSLAQKEQHAQPHPPSQKDDNQEKQDRSGEVTEDKLQSMPGSFPVENEQASRPKGYKSWDRKGSVIWMDPYGRYPAQIATNR